MQRQNHLHLVDADFHNWPVTMSLAVWPVKAANTTVMLHSDQITLQLPFVRARTSLTLLLDGGVCSSNQVCAGVCEGESIVSCNETCRIHIRSINDQWR